MEGLVGDVHRARADLGRELPCQRSVGRMGVHLAEWRSNSLRCAKMIEAFLRSDEQRP